MPKQYENIVWEKSNGQDFRTGPYFIMHTAFVLKEQ